PWKDVLDVVPRFMVSPGLVLHEGVTSDIDARHAPDALILTAAEKNIDYCTRALFIMTDTVGGKRRSDGSGGVDGDRGRAREDAEHWVRHRRDWEEVDASGFRRLAVYRLLEPDEYMNTLAFGVTKRAALPNTAAVCGRSTFHSEQRCTEQLCRRRTARDYSYVSANDQNRGPNDPGNYSVSCKYDRMKMLQRTGLERYNADMARIAAEREKRAKDAALQVHIE
ncbi:unnamed protein product, partial [Sphacelaria rigidula]